MIFLALLEYAILASTFTLAKIAVGHADPLFLIGVRMLIASPIMFFINYINKGSFRIEKNHIKFFLIISLLHIFFPFVFEFWALQYVSSSKTAIIYSLTPFISAFLSYIFLKQKLSRMQSLGLIIGLLGILPICISPDEVAFKAGEFLHISVPELVLFLAVFSASSAWFFIKDLMHKDYNISFINGFSMLVGGLLSMLCYLIFNNNTPAIKGDILDFWLWTLALVIVANVISYNFYGWLLKRMSINLMSVIGFSCPIFAATYGALFLHESLFIYYFIALILSGIGIALFYRGEKKIT